MARLVTVDLDDPGDLDRLVSEQERHHAGALVDPELTGTLRGFARKAADEGRISPEKRDEILARLECDRPRLVLDAFVDELVPNKPGLDGVVSADRTPPPPPPREVIERAAGHLIAADVVPLRAGLAGLADHLLAMGADADQVRDAFASVLGKAP